MIKRTILEKYLTKCDLYFIKKCDRCYLHATEQHVLKRNKCPCYAFTLVYMNAHLSRSTDEPRYGKCVSLSFPLTKLSSVSDNSGVC